MEELRQPAPITSLFASLPIPVLRVVPSLKEMKV
jgi:hypothetical protein